MQRNSAYDRPMSRVPGWAVLSSTAAPVLLIGGWTLAASRQPAFDSVAETISALAGRGATDRWLMTTALAGLGVCHLVTAAGLRPARTAGRAALGIGGAATVLVAAFPLPADGSSTAHTVVAGTAVVALAAWPALAWRRDSPVALLRPRAALAGAAGLLGLVGWFGASLGGDQVGLAERVAAGAQALWPLATVLISRGLRTPQPAR